MREGIFAPKLNQAFAKIDELENTIKVMEESHRRILAATKAAATRAADQEARRHEREMGQLHEQQRDVIIAKDDEISRVKETNERMATKLAACTGRIIMDDDLAALARLDTKLVSIERPVSIQEDANQFGAVVQQVIDSASQTAACRAESRVREIVKEQDERAAQDRQRFEKRLKDTEAIGGMKLQDQADKYEAKIERLKGTKKKAK